MRSWRRFFLHSLMLVVGVFLLGNVAGRLKPDLVGPASVLDEHLDGPYGAFAEPETLIVAFNSGYGNLMNPTTLVPDTTYTDGAGGFADGEVFRYCEVDKAAPDACIQDAWSRAICRSDVYWPDANQTFTFFWFNLSLLPNNIKILNARLNLYVDYGDRAYTDADYRWQELHGFTVALDTMQSDTGWLAAELGSTCGLASRVRNTKTSWNNMNMDTTSPWVPAFDDRKGYIDRGSSRYFGLASERFGSGTTVAAGDTMDINVKRVLQYYMDYKDLRGLSNAGFVCYALDDNQQGDILLSCGPHEANYSPSLIVEYVENSTATTQPWFDKAFAYCPTTDDGYKTANEAYMDSCDVYGVKYTIFVTQDYFGQNFGGRDIMDGDDVRAAYARGFQIEHHSVNHYPLGEVTTAHPESVLSQIERSWLADTLGIADADTLDAIRVFAYPGGSWSAQAESLLYECGYLAARTTVGGIFYNSFTDCPDVGCNPDWSDGHKPTWVSDTDTVNVFVCDQWAHDDLIDNDDTIDSLRVAHTLWPGDLNANLSHAIALSWERGQAPLVTLSHNEDGMTGSEWALILKYLLERGDFAPCPMGDMAQEYRDSHYEQNWYSWDDTDKCTHNLIAYSSAFDNAWWTYSNVALLGPTTPAPSGFAGNALQYDNTSTASSYIHRDSPSGFTYDTDNVLSAYVKAGDQLNGSGETFPQIAIFGIGGGAFTYAGWTLTASTCTYAVSGGGIDGYGSSDEGGGWFRIWIYVDGSTYSGVELRTLVYPNYNEPSGEYSAYLFGAQYEVGVTTPTALCETP